MFRGAYGILKLLPRDFARMTPGEYADQMAARAWVQEQRQRAGPQSPMERQMELTKFDRLIAERRARAEHR